MRRGLGYTVAGRGDATSETAEGPPLFGCKEEGRDQGSQTDVHTFRVARARTRSMVSHERRTQDDAIVIAQMPTLGKSSSKSRLALPRGRGAEECMEGKK